MILEIGKNCIASVEDLGPVLGSRSLRSLSVPGNCFADERVEDIIKARLPLLRNLNGKSLQEHRRKKRMPSNAR
jgi:hypothetical protein